ncbi:MAG: protein kinase domain-containing protein [Candidatus Acidiferrales bacterium]
MIGRTLSHYRIVEKLGAGGMGVVYRARDERLERDVAVKVLPASALADDATRGRFRKEALALSRMNHPNIAVVHDFDSRDGVDFIVMECVPGASLAEKFTGHPIPERNAAAIGQQIAAALEEAHEHNVIHRDLKPGNVMVTPKGQAKVLDFGLARMLHPATDEAPTASLSLLGAVGTLPYMAPEQVRGEPADARTDIHALGCILYEMATGRRLFAAKPVTELMRTILDEPPAPPRSLNRSLSPELERIILKCLEKDPGDRYQSARELVVDLRRFLQPSGAAAPVSRIARRRWLWRIGAAALLLATLFGLDLGGVRSRWFGGTAAPREIRSLAVLPLGNLSRDADQDYFVDGMTDALTTELSKIRELKVKSLASAMRFKNTEQPIPEIARALGVDAVLSGSVLHVGNRVRISAQLIDAASDTHLWAEEYERDISDVLKLHHDVARSVAGQIRLALATEHRSNLAAARSINPAAYEAYLRGRDLWRARTVQSLRDSLAFFERAVEIDPGYAPAYFGLADAYSSLVGYGVLPPLQGYPKAKTAALRALELDDTLAETHASLGNLASAADWDWQEAERHFRRAIELNPSYANAHAWYAGLLTNLGRFEEALPHSQQARELDPLSPATDLALGKLYYYSRRFEDAAREFQRTITRHPDYFIAPFYLSLAAYNSGDARKAIEVLEPRALEADIPELKMGLATYYAAVGRKAEADSLLAILLKEKQVGSLPAFILIAPYVGSKQYDRALDWMEQAYQERNWQLTFIGVEPLFDPLRSHPRFQALLKRMNFPPK